MRLTPAQFDSLLPSLCIPGIGWARYFLFFSGLSDIVVLSGGLLPRGHVAYRGIIRYEESQAKGTENETKCKAFVHASGLL